MQHHVQKIIAFYAARKRMPTYREIMELLGFKSKNAVSKLVDKMRDAGLITKDADGHLIPGRMFREVPILGTVEAGFPSPAEEELSDTMSLDEFLIRKKESTFILKVKGESMIEAGIMPGDMVIVERGTQAHEGDIVIAEVDHEWTMKYLTTQNGSIVLMPANRNYPPIVPQRDLNIAAVVRGVVRKYQ